MEGPQVNPWKNALLNQRATIVATGQPMPPMFTNWVDFLGEFQGKFLDPNKIENAGRALMSLKQIRSAREFSQEYDRLAELAGVSGEDFLLDQFRRNLKPIVQEKLLRQNFHTLQDLQIAAIEWDDILFQFRKQTRTTEVRRPPARPQPKPSNGTPMDLDFTKLSPEEEERRKKGRLCFRCGRPGHIGRNCPDNKGKKSNPRIAAVERPLSPISEATYCEPEEPINKDFQED